MTKYMPHHLKKNDKYGHFSICLHGYYLCPSNSLYSTRYNLFLFENHPFLKQPVHSRIPHRFPPSLYSYDAIFTSLSSLLKKNLPSFLKHPVLHTYSSSLFSFFPLPLIAKTHSKNFLFTRVTCTRRMFSHHLGIIKGAPVPT